MACMGSKFVTGDLRAEFLQAAKHKETGETLSHHMQQCGIDADVLAAKLTAGQAVFPLERVGRYIEVHIEQGPALLEAQKSLGIVTAIRGNVRYPQGITFYGEAAHSGSTPQPMRKDAAIAAAMFVSMWAQVMEGNSLIEGEDLVFSVPDIHVENPSSTTIPASCFVQLEARSISEKTLDDVRKSTKKFYDFTMYQQNLKGGNLSEPVIGKPAFMDGALQDTLENSANKLGFSSMRMPSGAGHDAGILANAGVPCGMLFIRHGRGGISHNSDELLSLDATDDPFATDSDFCKAVQVLADVMQADVPAPAKRFDTPFRPL